MDDRAPAPPPTPARILGPRALALALGAVALAAAVAGAFGRPAVAPAPAPQPGGRVRVEQRFCAVFTADAACERAERAFRGYTVNYTLFEGEDGSGNPAGSVAVMYTAEGGAVGRATSELTPAGRYTLCQDSTAFRTGWADTPLVVRPRPSTAMGESQVAVGRCVAFDLKVGETELVRFDNALSVASVNTGGSSATQDDDLPATGGTPHQGRPVLTWALAAMALAMWTYLRRGRHSGLSSR